VVEIPVTTCELTEECDSSHEAQQMSQDICGLGTGSTEYPDINTQQEYDTPSCSKTPVRKLYKVKRIKRSTPNVSAASKAADCIIDHTELKRATLIEQHEWLREKHELEMRVLNEQLKMNKIEKGEEICLCINTNK